MIARTQVGGEWNFKEWVTCNSVVVSTSISELKRGEISLLTGAISPPSEVGVEMTIEMGRRLRC